MRRVGALAVYAAALLGLACVCASAEQGLLAPWMLFFAPLTGLSHWISWDGPDTPVLLMFFGVALLWPLAGFALRFLPVQRRGGVARAGLLLHYVSGLALAVSSLNASQRALLGDRTMVGLIILGLAVYAAGQALIWRNVRGRT